MSRLALIVALCAACGDTWDPSAYAWTAEIGARLEDETPCGSLLLNPHTTVRWGDVIVIGESAVVADGAPFPVPPSASHEIPSGEHWTEYVVDGSEYSVRVGLPPEPCPFQGTPSGERDTCAVTQTVEWDTVSAEGESVALAGTVSRAYVAESTGELCADAYRVTWFGEARAQ